MMSSSALLPKVELTFDPWKATEVTVPGVQLAGLGLETEHRGAGTEPEGPLGNSLTC